MKILAPALAAHVATYFWEDMTAVTFFILGLLTLCYCIQIHEFEDYRCWFLSWINF